MGSASKSASLFLIVLLAASSLIMIKPAGAQTAPTATALNAINTPPAGALIVPDQYPTIQDAIDNASAGNTVFVKEGTYNVSGLYIDKPLSLVGEDSQKTVIYSNAYAIGGLNTEAIDIVTNHVTVTGFTIIGNNLESSSIYLSGINSQPSQPSDCKIIGNIIENNLNGIATGGENNIISDNFITNNSDCGIQLSSSDSAIVGNTLSGNGGFGVIIDGCQDVTIKQNDIVNNGFGNETNLINQLGGLDIQDGPVFVYENNITNNFGFGVQFDVNASYSKVYNNNIIGNGRGINLLNFASPSQFGPIIGSGNKVYNNNFIDNSQNAFIEEADPYSIPNITGNGTDAVSWDNGKAGNYWSDYSGHGVYVIGPNNTDYYPLTNQVNISTAAPTLRSTQFVITFFAVVVFLVIVISLLIYGRHQKTKSSVSRPFSTR